MTDDTQEKRREVLRNLADTYHRSKHGDYISNYAEFAVKYLGATLDDEGVLEDDIEDTDTQPIPKYASIAEDETYGMIHVCDSLDEALSHQAGIPDNGEYLNVPAGIVDLDNGERVQTHRFEITAKDAETMKMVFTDAIEYRCSDDDDEDGEQDNKDVQEYLTIARRMGIAPS